MSERRMRRVGHKGADLIVPGNTPASFDAAVAVGVDMIEFDVLPAPPAKWRSISVAAAERRSYVDTPLVLAHDWTDAASRTPESLVDGLDHLAGEAFAGVEFDVDLKLPGYELRVLAALRERELIGRTLVSSQYRSSLAILRKAEPGLRLGLSVPKLSFDPFRSPLLVPLAIGAVRLGRVIMPGRAAAAIRSGSCDALMANWRLVTPRLVEAVAGAGGELYVWTVDDLPLIQSLHALGVTGVISNDPRLFAALA
jgi:glycerophosphoryl diester phosphodiesterase